VSQRWCGAVLAAALLPVPAAIASASQQAGAIRGAVSDKEFDAPLAGATVLVVETKQSTVSDEQGGFALRDVPPGRYTVVFSKEGYLRVVRVDVVVTAGKLTDLAVALPGDYTELDEFVVEDLMKGGASEAALLELRLETPQLLDSIGSELIGRSGAGDAASALRLVAGASVADGKTAVVRGLPDRYVSSQLNGVRLPSADEDKRAVELDQFPSPVIDSIQVSKTFTPDQQGDASGGAVDVVLKGIPEESLLQLKIQGSANSQVWGEEDFLTYHGGGVNTWGEDHSRHQQLDKLGQDWDGAAGTTTEHAPDDWKMSLAAGTKWNLGRDWKLGGLVSFFYERDSSFYDDGVDDSWWVENPGDPLTPVTTQGAPGGEFKTGLLDVTRGSQMVQWGGLATAGLESDHHSVHVNYLYTRTAEDVATLATDTRSKEYFFPGYDKDDINDPGNLPQNRDSAPYLRLETLEYTERSSDSLQFHGDHDLRIGKHSLGPFKLLEPKLDWSVSRSRADLDQPDKRQFGALWLPEVLNPGFPPFLPPFLEPPVWVGYKPGANFTLGNFQRIWKKIEEESDQYAVDLHLPFEQWSKREGEVKFGYFDDSVDRKFDQDTFSNFNDNSTFNGDWDEPWSEVFPDEPGHPITASSFDVDYKGEIDVTAWYGMVEMPLAKPLTLIGGARRESTKIGVVNEPESGATWFPPGSVGPVALNPGDADVDFEDEHLLPALGLTYEPWQEVTLRGSWSRTIARQTFKELTPIMQQDYLGGPIFIGNPELGMSKLQNWDLRLDWRPQPTTFLSASWFHKDIEDPIEYVQKVISFTYTTAQNYPRGKMTGYELEARQGLGDLWKPLGGLSLGANATFIHARVDLPDDEIAIFELPNIDVPMTSRDMTNAPEHLFNVYTTYDVEATGTQLALFWTVTGDTLVAGATTYNGNFIPHVYAKEYATLNATLSQPLGPWLRLILQATNLTNPEIKEVYRSPVTSEKTKTSYTKGIDYSIGLGAEFRF